MRIGIGVTAKISVCGSTGVNSSLAPFHCTGVHLALLQGRAWSFGLGNQRQPDAVTRGSCTSLWIRKIIFLSTLDQLSVSV